MTRYTNVGWKRTYFQASTGPDDSQISAKTASTSVQLEGSPHDAAASSHTPYGSSIDTPAEPNRKRRRKSKSNPEPNMAAESIPATIAGDEDETRFLGARSERTKVPAAKLKLKAKEKARKAKTAADRAALTETRRLKRIAGRSAHMTCFACREVGHSTKDCPSIRADANRNGPMTTKTNAKTTAGVVVGICYRCGSRKHNLARCRQPAQPDDPLPYASCFVCSGQGHLASSCPRNNGRGVYPNGGSCKLCGDTTHLARDCTLRKTEGSAVATLLGTGHDGGADEDDFHTIRRKNAEVDKDEHGEERSRKEAKVRAGAFTGTVKAFGKAPEKPKKVVYF